MSEKHYISENTQLMAEWDQEKNTALGIDPQTLTQGCHTKVWWICEKGHSYETQIVYRVKGSGCPYCANKKALRGYNDLQTVNPTLAKEWNYKRNNGLTPADVTPSSHKKVWWKCNKGHEWQATISSRNRGRGCPCCSGRSVIKGVNDLQTVNPTLAKEWNYEKNNGLTPMDVMPNSDKKAWWKCCEGHEWQATINSRSNGIGCPYCSGRLAIKGENDLETVNPTLAKEWNYEKNDGLTPDEVMPNSNKKVWWQC